MVPLNQLKSETASLLEQEKKWAITSVDDVIEVFLHVLDSHGGAIHYPVKGLGAKVVHVETAGEKSKA